MAEELTPEQMEHSFDRMIAGKDIADKRKQWRKGHAMAELKRYEDMESKELGCLMCTLTVYPDGTKTHEPDCYLNNLRVALSAVEQRIEELEKALERVMSASMAQKREDDELMASLTAKLTALRASLAEARRG